MNQIVLEYWFNSQPQNHKLKHWVLCKLLTICWRYFQTQSFKINPISLTCVRVQFTISCIGLGNDLVPNRCGLLPEPMMTIFIDAYMCLSTPEYFCLIEIAGSCNTLVTPLGRGGLKRGIAMRSATGLISCCRKHLAGDWRAVGNHNR